MTETEAILIADLVILLLRQRGLLCHHHRHESKERTHKPTLTPPPAQPILLQGPRGPKGDKGDNGDRGPKGQTGDQGPPGSSSLSFQLEVQENLPPAYTAVRFAAGLRICHGLEAELLEYRGISSNAGFMSGAPGSYYPPDTVIVSASIAVSGHLYVLADGSLGPLSAVNIGDFTRLAAIAQTGEFLSVLAGPIFQRTE